MLHFQGHKQHQWEYKYIVTDIRDVNSSIRNHFASQINIAAKYTTEPELLRSLSIFST